MRERNTFIHFSFKVECSLSRSSRPSASSFIFLLSSSIVGMCAGGIAITSPLFRAENSETCPALRYFDVNLQPFSCVPGRAR